MSRGRDFNTLPNRTFVPFISVAQNVCCLSLLREMVRLSQLDSRFSGQIGDNECIDVLVSDILTLAYEKSTDLGEGSP